MEIKTDIEFTESKRLPDVYTESQSEYSLPDYNREVRKILYTSADLQPSGRFVGNDEIAFSGIIVYNLVYLDGENNIASTSFTSDYDYTVKCSQDGSQELLENARIASYAVRVLGPRKVSARASVVSTVRQTSGATVSVLGDAFTGAQIPQVLNKTVNVRSTSSSATLEREYAERLARLEGAVEDEVEIILTDTVCKIDEISASEGQVSLCGKLTLASIIRNGDEPAYLVSKAIPFEESVPFDGARADMAFSPNVTVISEKASVNPDDTGCEVVVSVIVEMSLYGEYNQQVSVITDAYIKGCESDCEYGEFCYTELVGEFSDCRVESASAPRSDIESEKLREVVYLSASAKPESVKPCAKGVEVSGEIKYTGFASEILENGRVGYIPIKFSAPFKRNVNINCQNSEDLRFETRVRGLGATASIDENNIVFEADLEISGVALRDTSVKRVCRLDSKGETASASCKASITVYYPDDKDTLFSVAKRFLTSPERIALDNSIDTSASADGSELSLAKFKRIIIS